MQLERALNVIPRRALLALCVLAAAVFFAAAVPGQAQALDKPVLSAVEMTDKGPSFSWEAIEGATSYRIYRREKVDGSWSKWKRIATNEGQDECSYTDTAALYANTGYRYRVRAYAGSEHGSYSVRSSVTTPKMVDPEPELTRASGASSATVNWTVSQYCDGYTVEYSASKLFADAEQLEVEGRASDEAVLEGLDATATYYVRVRAHQVIGSATSHSYWGYSENATVTTTASVTLLNAKETLSEAQYTSGKAAAKKARTAAKKAYAKAKTSYTAAKKTYASAKKAYSKAKKAYAKKGTKKAKKACAKAKKAYQKAKKAYTKAKSARTEAKTAYAQAKATYQSYGDYSYDSALGAYAREVPFEIASAAGQVLGGYDTVQGSCSDGTYVYFMLYNRTVEKCKVAKVLLSTLEVVKVSGVLDVGHGNDVAYDPTRKCLVVAQGEATKLEFPLVDCKTLKVVERVEITAPGTLQGATATQLKNLSKGASGIIYDAASGRFVATIIGSHNFLYLDADFTPVSYAKVSSKSVAMRQNSELVGEYMIAVSEAPKASGQANQLHIYDTDGTSVRTVTLKLGHELESVFAVGDDLYASVYASGANSRENYLYKLNVGISEL